MKLSKIILVLVFSQLGWARTKVAMVLDRSDLCKTQLCLYGIHASKTSVLILSADSGKVCKVKVGAHFKAPYSPGNFDATELVGVNKCNFEKEKAFLAVFERPRLRHQILNPKVLDEEELAKDDKKLKRDSVFVNTWKHEPFHPGGDKSRIAYTTADYRRLKSEAFDYKTPKGHLKIYRQIFPEGSNKGVLFAKLNNTWSEASSSFTLEDPIVFTIDKRIFIWSKASCQMPCGHIENEIYEYNGLKFKKIYSNMDLSN